jgi:hypothetical protein
LLLKQFYLLLFRDPESTKLIQEIDAKIVKSVPGLQQLTYWIVEIEKFRAAKNPIEALQVGLYHGKETTLVGAKNRHFTNIVGVVSLFNNQSYRLIQIFSDFCNQKEDQRAD